MNPTFEVNRWYEDKSEDACNKPIFIYQYEPGYAIIKNEDIIKAIMVHEEKALRYPPKLIPFKSLTEDQKFLMPISAKHEIDGERVNDLVYVRHLGVMCYALDVDTKEEVICYWPDYREIEE